MARVRGQVRSLATALLPSWLLAGCGTEPVQMLHERPSFEGRITLQGDGLSLAGELVFDRDSGNCQLTRRKPATVALGRDRNGSLFAFEDGGPRPVRPEEMRQLRVVLAVVDGSGISRARLHEQGYSVELPLHGRVRIILHEARIRRQGHHR